VELNQWGKVVSSTHSHFAMQALLGAEKLVLKWVMGEIKETTICAFFGRNLAGANEFFARWLSER